MSWLSRSIADTFHHLDAAAPSENLPPETAEENNHDISGDDDVDQGRGGVKEDLSEFKDTLTRQLLGVASFLAPPPRPPPPPPPLPPLSIYYGGDVLYNEDDEELSQVDEEDCEFNAVEEEAVAVGITEEVLAFAGNIAHHPETWLDFPLSEEEEEFRDFDLSDAQYQHALTVENFAPSLAALRIELCPAHMSEGYFWMVYFVLLHSRLNKQDGDLLSSPQIMQARAIWMQELQKQTKEDSYWMGTNTFQSKNSVESSPHGILYKNPYEDTRFGNMSNHMSPFEYTMHHMTAQHESVKQAYGDVEFIDKSVIKEDPLPEIQEDMDFGPSTDIPMQDDDEDDNYWLKEDSDLIRLSGISIIVNEEDISFSDLEDDIDFTMPLKPRIPSSEWNITADT